MLYAKRDMPLQIEPRYRYGYFNHIFRSSYSAGYYSYIWSEVLDKDAYEAFVESGDIFNRVVADRFRKEVLEKGGSLDGDRLYRNFRGADPSREPLLWGRGLKERPVTERPELPVFDEDDIIDDTDTEDLTETQADEL